MVGPSITDDDRKQFLRRLKIGFAVLIGISMAMVTVYSGADLPVIIGVFAGTTALGGLFAWIAIPDSVAGMPYDTRERGPKPGVRTRERRARDNDQPTPQRADGSGQQSRDSEQ